MPSILSVERLDKHYGAVHAVSGVSLAFEAGEVHAVVGENGAGKSTLLKMAAGVVVPDAGEVRVAGRVLAPHTAHEAIARGVGMVQQHFALVGVLSALDNVMLGAEPVRSMGRLDRAAARTQAERVAREMGVSLPWDAPVESLGVGDRQRLEIVRTLVRDARVVILDEPTAVLTPGEAEQLYAALRRMAEAGRAIVVVTHRLDEVRNHADRVSVMRRGRLVATYTMSPAYRESLMRDVTRDIMGEDPPPPVERRARERGQVALDLRDVRLGRALRGVTLSVNAGEIVGIAGVEGNGQRELVRVLAGLEEPESGTVRAGRVVVVHEDRHAEGLVLGASVRDNLVLGELGAFTSRAGIVDAAALEREAARRLERARVVPPDLGATVAALSGGNQQKVVVARAVAREARADAFVFAQPTRGVDLGAARAIHGEIASAADAGKAVLLVSADLAELRALADRVLVMARGRIVAELAPDAPDARIGEAMLGGSEGTAS
ncbi:MAG TPA: ATP-binding cassette domain-containing protein [Polyangiaceae bacterium]|nr:ATP-binding cassette domain-containing protein [Polyangiaceae bacterium]